MRPDILPLITVSRVGVRGKAEGEKIVVAKMGRGLILEDYSIAAIEGSDVVAKLRQLAWLGRSIARRQALRQDLSLAAKLSLTPPIRLQNKQKEGRSLTRRCTSSRNRRITQARAR